MARQDASELAHSLGRQAEAVCRHYLSNGHRQGNYWQVGDARNVAGRSMFVRLRDTPKGPAGKWTDAATGEHGEAIPLSPAFGDFNEDLRRLGIDALRAGVRVQLAPEDVARFMNLAA